MIRRSPHWGPANRTGELALRAANLAKGRKINNPNPRCRSACPDHRPLRGFDFAAVMPTDPADRLRFFDFGKAGLAVRGSVVDSVAT